MPWWGWALVAVAFVLGGLVAYVWLMLYLAKGFRR